MKVKFISMVFGLALVSSGVVYAQDSKREEYFSENKAQMLKNLTEEKSGLEQVLGCVNSAKNQDDMKKCHDLKKANMEKMRDLKRAERKEHLQKQLKKIDEEGKDSKKD